jgi:hypothetical protein
MDSVGDNSLLALYIAKRYTYTLAHHSDLVLPRYHSLNKNILRETADQYEVVFLDSPDETYFPLADIFITLVSNSEDLRVLTEKNSPYASIIWQAKKARAAGGRNAFRWVVVPNGTFSEKDLADLSQSGKFLGFAVAPSLTKRPEYQQGLASGITVLDKDLPEFKSSFGLPDFYARRELKKIAEFIWQNR